LEYIGFKKVGNLPDIVRFKFLSVYIRIKIEVNVKEIFGPVILVHTYISKLKIDDDVIVGEEGRKFD
jgi:hypothetical protein